MSEEIMAKYYRLNCDLCSHEIGYIKAHSLSKDKPTTTQICLVCGKDVLS